MSTKINPTTSTFPLKLQNFTLSLIADLHIFVYGRAECDTISLEFTKVKPLILNDFGLHS